MPKYGNMPFIFHSNSIKNTLSITLLEKTRELTPSDYDKQQVPVSENNLNYKILLSLTQTPTITF